MTSDAPTSPTAGTDDPASGPPPVPILVVDDDEMKRYALTRLLSPLGYYIVQADSGLGALRCVLAQDFAVILLDVRMPGMDGFETAARIRTRRRSQHTPIILITASTRAEIVASGLYGDSVTEFMLAPVELDDLRMLVSVLGNLFLNAQKLAVQGHQAQVSADRWQVRTEAAPVGIFQTDRQHRYTYTNPRWSEITGIPTEAALGQDWRVIVNAEQASRLVDGSGEEVARRGEVSHRIEIRTPGADPKMVLLTSTLVQDSDGGNAGWVGTLALAITGPQDETPIPEARAP